MLLPPLIDLLHSHSYSIYVKSVALYAQDCSVLHKRHRFDDEAVDLGKEAVRDGVVIGALPLAELGDGDAAGQIVRALQKVADDGQQDDPEQPCLGKADHTSQ